MENGINPDVFGGDAPKWDSWVPQIIEEGFDAYTLEEWQVILSGYHLSMVYTRLTFRSMNAQIVDTEGNYRDNFIEHHFGDQQEVRDSAEPSGVFVSELIRFPIDQWNQIMEIVNKYNEVDNDIMEELSGPEDPEAARIRKLSYRDVYPRDEDFDTDDSGDVNR